MKTKQYFTNIIIGKILDYIPCFQWNDLKLVNRSWNFNILKCAAHTRVLNLTHASSLMKRSWAQFQPSFTKTLQKHSFTSSSFLSLAPRNLKSNGSLIREWRNNSISQIRKGILDNMVFATLRLFNNITEIIVNGEFYEAIFHRRLGQTLKMAHVDSLRKITVVGHSWCRIHINVNVPATVREIHFVGIDLEDDETPLKNNLYVSQTDICISRISFQFFVQNYRSRSLTYSLCKYRRDIHKNRIPLIEFGCSCFYDDVKTVIRYCSYLKERYGLSIEDIPIMGSTVPKCFIDIGYLTNLLILNEKRRMYKLLETAAENGQILRIQKQGNILLTRETSFLLTAYRRDPGLALSLIQNYGFDPNAYEEDPHSIFHCKERSMPLIFQLLEHTDDERELKQFCRQLTQQRKTIINLRVEYEGFSISEWAEMHGRNDFLRWMNTVAADDVPISISTDFEECFQCHMNSAFRPEQRMDLLEIDPSQSLKGEGIYKVSALHSGAVHNFVYWIALQDIEEWTNIIPSSVMQKRMEVVKLKEALWRGLYVRCVRELVLKGEDHLNYDGRGVVQLLENTREVNVSLASIMLHVPSGPVPSIPSHRDTGVLDSGMTIMHLMFVLFPLTQLLDLLKLNQSPFPLEPIDRQGRSPIDMIEYSRQIHSYNKDHLFQQIMYVYFRKTWRRKRKRKNENDIMKKMFPGKKRRVCHT